MKQIMHRILVVIGIVTAVTLASATSMAQTIAVTPGTIKTIAGNGVAGEPSPGSVASGNSIEPVYATAVAPILNGAGGDIYFSESTNYVKVIYEGGAAAKNIILANAALNDNVTTPVVGDIYLIAGNGTAVDGDASTGAAAGSPGTWLLSSSAVFTVPCGLAVDSYGNLFISNNGNSSGTNFYLNDVVQVVYAGNISAQGTNPAANLINLENTSVSVSSLTTGTTYNGYLFNIAGTYQSDSDNAVPGWEIGRDYPHGVVVDNYENVYIAFDDGSVSYVEMIYSGAGANALNLLQKEGYTGIIAGYGYALAGGITDQENDYGDGSLGYEGAGAGEAGTATSAPYNVWGIGVNPTTGDVYFSDSKPGKVRKLSASTGIISTVVGPDSGTADSGTSRGDGGLGNDGTNASESAALDTPLGIYVDAGGNIYIADSLNNAIRKLDANGYISTIAGTNTTTGAYSGDSGNATAANLDTPYDVKLDASGNLWIADEGNSRIRKVTVNASVAGTQGSSVTSSGSFAFGNVTDYSDSAAVAGLISNLTGSAITPSNVSIPADYIQVAGGNAEAPDCSTSTAIPAGTTCTLALEFAPVSAGLNSASATVAANSDSVTIPMTGTGVDGVTSTPTFSPAAGTYTSAQTVTISSATSGATIYYTTNGTTPTTSSTLYSAPISVADTETVKALAVKSGDTNSAVGTAAYTINLTVATPTFSPAAGTYTTAQTVTISDATSGATIYYTTNGTTPTTSSTVYSAPISVAATETVKALAVKSGDTNSTVGSAAYTINIPSTYPVTDAFSGTGALSENWTNTTAYGTPFVALAQASGIVVPSVSGAQGLATYTGVTFSANQYSQAKWVNSTTAGGITSVCVRMDTAGDGICWMPDLVDYPPGVFAVTNGVWNGSTLITGCPTPANGDTIQLLAVGTTYTCTDVTTGVNASGTSSVYASGNPGIIVDQDDSTSYALAAFQADCSPTCGSGSSPAATPTFSPAAGTYTSAQSVTISDATSGATIYYTTNGTTPTTSSTLYSAPISVAASETVEALAVKSGYTNSAVGSAAYTITLPTVATPTFSPAAGTYTTAQTVTISDATSGATIYYTTNGTTPTTSSTVYSAPISVAATETVKALAVKSSYTNSAVGSAAYTITLPTVATPTFSPAAGTYTTAQTVTISSATSGATIYYTTNGTTPTTSSTVYSTAISVAATETVKALAVKSGYTNSAVGSAAYTITSYPAAATPTFSPAAGTYTTPQTVTISDTTSGVTIYYTTNGTTPTTSSSVYSSPITVTPPETVEAIATATGYTTSAVGSASYVASGATTPVILFTDIQSGPATGGENGNGIYLNIFGYNFGSTQGASTVTINGTAVAQYLTWGSAGIGTVEKIGVQIAAGTTTGPIVVNVGGHSSVGNPTFTVRAGNIWFIGSGTDNSTPGTCTAMETGNSYASPWGLTNADVPNTNGSYSTYKTPYTYYNCISLGDFLVFLNGVDYPNYDGRGWSGSLTIDKSGTTSTSFITVQARPGASAILGGGQTNMNGISNTGSGDYTVYSGLTLIGQGTNDSSALYMWSYDRAVGNTLECPSCDGQAAGGMNASEGVATGIEALGNEITQVSTNTALLPNGSGKEFHDVYFAGNNWEFAWNRIYNTAAYNGVQVNEDSTSGFYNFSIHDNDIADVNGSGINLAYIDPSSGYVQVYNNVIHHTGVNIADGGSGGDPHSCIAIDGYGSATGVGTAEIYNNTMYDCSSYLNLNASSNDSCAIMNQSGQLNVTANLVNNIAYQPTYAGTSQQNVYICGGGSAGTLSGSNNIWYSDSAPGSTAYATAIGTIENPLYSNPTDGSFANYLLQSGSPAIGAGIAVGPVVADGISYSTLNWDFDYSPRPNPPSIGAFEFPQ